MTVQAGVGEEGVSASGTAFIIMPFMAPFNSYYTQIIRPALADIDYKAIRSDEIFSPQAFVQTIWEEILNCDLVVAEMTGSNPNVLYELGLAHAIGKRVVMITRSPTDVPADLRHINCISYDTNLVSWDATLRRSLQEMVVSRSITRSLLAPVASVADAEAIAEAEVARAAALNELRAIKARNLILEEANKRHLLEVQEVRTALSRKLSDETHSGASRPIARAIAFGNDDSGRDLAYLELSDGVLQEFVRVPAGRFTYGFGPNATLEDLGEYWISRFSVTNQQYAVFLNTCGNRLEQDAPWIDLNGRSPVDRCRIRFDGKLFKVEDGYLHHPVTYVNYFGAWAYSSWIGGELPSSEMWERAARGDDGRNYPWGNSPPTPATANVDTDGSWPRDVAPIEVREKASGVSPHGVVQAIGNVWHWTSTYFPDRDVQVVRGGVSFDYRLGNRRVYRFQVSPDGPDLSQGILPILRLIYNEYEVE